MSTFGNNLIERLATRLAAVRPQNQFRERSIALAKILSIGERENGANGRADCPGRLLCRLESWETRLGFYFPGSSHCLKNLRCPLVFFTHREMRSRWFLGNGQFFGMPFEIARQDETMSIAEFLKIE